MIARILIPLLFVAFAAICKALADELAWKYSWFILKFPKLKSDFWKINEVHRKVHYIANFPIDAWHISNSLGAIAMILLPYVYKPYFAWYIEFPVLIVWGFTVFNIFYIKVFR